MIGCSLFLTIFIVSNAFATDEVMNIELLRQVRGNPSNVKLIEIVDQAKTSTTLIERYGDLSIPETAQGETIEPYHVLLALSRAGVNLSQVRLLSTHAVKIISNQQNDVVSLIKSKIESYLKKSHWIDKDTRSFHVTNIPGNLPSRDTFMDVDIEFRDLQEGSQEVLVKFINQKNQTIMTTLVRGTFEEKHKVLVAKRLLLDGETVSAEDFEVSEKDILDGNEYMSSLSDLGQSRWTLKRTLSQGAPLDRRALSYVASMKKGDIVTLLAGDKQFQIRARGRVKEVMSDGGSVLVENIDSKKEILGKPVNPGEVQIVY